TRSRTCRPTARAPGAGSRDRDATRRRARAGTRCGWRPAAGSGAANRPRPAGTPARRAAARPPGRGARRRVGPRGRGLAAPPRPLRRAGRSALLGMLSRLAFPDLILPDAFQTHEVVALELERLQLALELDVAVPALLRQRPGGERLLDGAPRLGGVGAVVEAALRGDLLDVAEG